jgi:Protein of unknown function (DUF4238)
MRKKKKANPARRHHYIPQLYLGGFTDSGDKSGLLYAHDLRESKTWQAKPANVALVKDFYKIDAPGVDPDEIEKLFWEVEGEAARILKKIIQLKKLPARRKDYYMLMRFMAQVVIRRPSVRENLQRQQEKLLRMVAKMHASLPDDQLRARFDQMREENPEMAEVDLNAFREFVRSDAYSIDFPQNYHINNLLTALLPAADAIAPYLAARHWVLWEAQDGAGHFITTDRPVHLSWTVRVPPMFEDNPGFALENTVVVFALSKGLAMFGKFDGPSGAVIPANAKQVALMNRIIARSVVRFIYSTDENFAWQKDDGSVGDRRQLFEVVRTYKARNAAEAALGEGDPAQATTEGVRPARATPDNAD